jgi:hypothetical protein
MYIQSIYLVYTHTAMVTTQDAQGNKVELTNQKEMEKAILESNH